jgi:TPP-dependent 2-oxoacid decarboxylase
VLQASLKKFTIYETNPNLTGVYNVKVRVLDAKSKVENQSLTFQVTVLCTKSIVVLTDPILNVSRLMEIDPPQTFTYNMPTYDVNPSFCLKGAF